MLKKTTVIVKWYIIPKNINTYVIRVALPVNEPNLISSNGDLNPSTVRASSCVTGGML